MANLYAYPENDNYVLQRGDAVIKLDFQDADKVAKQLSVWLSFRQNVEVRPTKRAEDGEKVAAKVICLKCNYERVVVGRDWDEKCPNCGELQYEYDSRFGGF